jgi:hypothetical protein
MPDTIRAMTDEMAPLIPVYLNQRMVFDLLAMLQDGLSQVAKITTTETDKDTLSREAGATFGVANAFASLLKIDLSARRVGTKESAGETARTEERVHTPASLFFKLRQMLRERNQLTSAAELPEFRAGQIVELATTLRRNPVVELMDSMIAGFGMFMTFVDQAPQQTGKVPAKKGAPPDNTNARISHQMRSFREALGAGPTIDIVSERRDLSHAAVITLENEYVSDPTMSNLVEGQFIVLGKVIRVISEGESISLLRKTAMSILPKETLESTFRHFDQLSTTQGYLMPKAEWEVPGPALHILPVAIYA